ncbi:MAG TPA: fructose-bisphosphate aldolase, partial [Clostridiales bacterium]|nr:fructose-bisphosphate aldolase [Clostridiales bacterium]
AEVTPVPMALHLDHATNMDFIRRALKEGFTSIMIDASDQDFARNVEITNTARALCRKYGASLEAELGHVGGTAGRF